MGVKIIFKNADLTGWGSRYPSRGSIVQIQLKIKQPHSLIKNSSNFPNADLIGWVSRYLGWGILTPTQLSLHDLENLKNFLFTCKAVLFSVVFDVYIQGFKKTKRWNFVTSVAKNRGWGSRYPGWGILSPTQLSLHLENLKIFLFTYKAVLFSIVFEENV